ncbi:MAG TPA: PepSY-associated TM helix domain-containing protein [Ignavibacteriaceae bacterium]|nr:PepSY-associated TM helix domain-containing protein [Ignavibacteriaceae bacterium]
MRWRKWLRILHRDIGYLAAGLTVIYAISGVAVNHVGDWNPNYSIEKTTIVLDSIPSNYEKDEMVAYILSQLGETREVKNSFRPDPNKLDIFIEGNTINVNYDTREVTQEKVVSRPIIRETNFLHLNAPKKVWTYVADVFAVALAFLAISGLFMIKGKNGITGRGAWLTALGILLPIIFLLIYYY